MMTSPLGENLTNEFDCPQWNWKTNLKLSSLQEFMTLSIEYMNECTETCVFRDSTELQTVERGESPRLVLIYDHDNSNNIYSLNKFSYNKLTISRKINDFKSFLDI